ncbi:MAG: hypothetical protein K0R47_3926 [Brevibacillus sp.]|nr:hypothetical protein [Brevibacillus sp.]
MSLLSDVNENNKQMILGLQHYLSRRMSPYWGAILPVIYLAFFVYGYLFGLFHAGTEVSMILAVIGGTAILSLAWVNGRTAVKNRRKKELEKMELLDF